MVDYAILANTATSLLTDNGQNLTFGRETSSGFNPVTGVDTTASSTYTGYGAGFDYKKSEVDGEVIQNGDVRLILQAVTTAPLIGDTVTYNGSVYRVMNVNEVSPGGTVVIYKLQLRV